MQRKFPSITVTGAIGSGKSTVCKMISERFAFLPYSTGAAQRKIASEMGITTLQLNKVADTDKSIDEKIDNVFKTLGKNDGPYVVDSRMAFFFMPESFKVKLEVDNECAAERIFSDTLRTNEKKYESVEDALKTLIERRKSEISRFKKVYGVDIEEHDNFDFVIDTTNLTPDEVFNDVMVEYQRRFGRLFHISKK